MNTFKPFITFPSAAKMRQEVPTSGDTEHEMTESEVGTGRQWIGRHTESTQFSWFPQSSHEMQPNGEINWNKKCLNLDWRYLVRTFNALSIKYEIHFHFVWLTRNAQVQQISSFFLSPLSNSFFNSVENAKSLKRELWYSSILPFVKISNKFQNLLWRC